MWNRLESEDIEKDIDGKWRLNPRLKGVQDYTIVDKFVECKGVFGCIDIFRHDGTNVFTELE